MIYYWYRIFRILLERNFKRQIDVEQEFSKDFTVRLFDCDGLRVMTAYKYAVYMDFARWEMIARSSFYNEVVLKGMAPTLGSQKIIYRKPLKRWTRFTVKVLAVGWDDKWVYHVHKFEQNGEVKAVGITRGLIWRKDKPQLLRQLLENVGVKQLNKKPPVWVADLFKNDTDIIAGNFEAQEAEEVMGAITEAV